LAWDKGEAVLYVLAALGLDGGDVLPVYVGDDVTDEDAFRVLRERERGGIGVRVADEAAETGAEFRLEGPEEVPEFLARLAEAVEGEGG
jgi:trehalose 6-phosphate phosphatase